MMVKVASITWLLPSFEPKIRSGPRMRPSVVDQTSQGLEGPVIRPDLRSHCGW